MSQYSKLMLWAAIALILTHIGFYISISDGLSLGERSPLFMAVAVLGFLGSVAFIIFLQQWISRPEARPFPDEREKAVDIRSEQVGGRILEGGVFAVIALTIYEASAEPGSFGSYSLTRPEGLLFALVTVISIAGLARFVVALVRDRLG